MLTSIILISSHITAQKKKETITFSHNRSVVFTLSTFLDTAFVVFVSFERGWQWLSGELSTGPEMFIMIFGISSMEIVIIMIVKKLTSL